MGERSAASAPATTPTRRCAANIRSVSRRSGRRTGGDESTLSLLVVAVALLLGAVGSRSCGRVQARLPAAPRNLDPRDRTMVWKIPAIDESTTLKVKAAVPRRNRGADTAAQHLRARHHRPALAHPRARRARRESDPLLPALGDPDRCAGAGRAPGWQRATRAHPTGEPAVRREAKPGLGWEVGSRCTPCSASSTS